MKAIAFVVIAVAWVALDQWTKSLFAGDPGVVYGSALGGLVDLRLVHNTGAAWGIFAGNPLALGVFSLVVCLAVAAYFLYSIRTVTEMQTIGLALIVAGGVGNAIDRFASGYVTDFIAVTFIDFPVFNVADIGVTCGVAILLIGLFLEWRREGDNMRKADFDEKADGRNG